MKNVPCARYLHPLLIMAMAITMLGIGGKTYGVTNEMPFTQSVLSLLDQVEIAEPAAAAAEDTANLFARACSQCHDTGRATSRQKSYDEWVLTVRRMADKPGSQVPSDQIEAIAAYLTSLNPPEPDPEPAKSVPSITDVLAESDITLNATVSLLWRNGDQQVENEGFFPDVWVGAEWHPQDNPFSIQIMACTTCHDDGSFGLNAELLEGSFSADLIHLVTGRSASERSSEVELEAKAGRFVVPFGAFSDMVHPGVYRTLTNPLMYNMGRRVGDYIPVLPMPYADEGVNLSLEHPLLLGISTRIDGYAVNGLEEGGFTPSRSYKDNNSNAALGARAALGNAWFSIGGSYATGELQASGSPKNEYMLSGGDLRVRYLDYIRLYYEYARREEDAAPSVDGHVVELEGQVWGRPKISLLVRYDSNRDDGGATIERFTWGPNITLRGGSVLILNHEHWKHDAPLNNEDIIGIRWVVVL